MTEISWIIVGALALFLIILLCLSYVKTSPNQALVISGWPRKNPKFLVGTGGLRIPGLQKVDHLYLGQFSVDIKAQKIPTKDFINVDVDAVAKICVDRVSDDPNDTPEEKLRKEKLRMEQLNIAAANFLNMNPQEIAKNVQESLEGNMREIVGTMELKELNLDRDGFSNEIQKKAAVDMTKLGLKILTCNIQNITDEKGLIQDLGADNTYMIKKNASINKANAERDVAIAEAQAKKEANDARVQSETEIAIKNTDLAVKQADLKKKADTQRAMADAAYEIQKQEQAKEINVKTVEAQAAKQIRVNERQKEINKLEVEAQVEKAKQEQALREQEIAIQEKTLAAKVNKQADADKYQKEVNAAAELEQRKRKAEAERYEAEQKALAVKAQAEADLFAQQQKAAGIKAVGEAEAAAIQAKGEAEAAAMEKKAEAYKKYEGAAVAQMLVDKLPEVAEKIAQPLSSIQDIHVYGTSGNEAAGISGNVPVVMKQTFDVMEQATGVNLGEIVQNNSKVIAAGADVKVKK